MLRRKLFYLYLKRGRLARRSVVRQRKIGGGNLKSKSIGRGIADERLKKLEKRKTGLGSAYLREDSARKRRKIRSADDENANVDRISELPEPIIHHIFSFLQCSKDVIRTAILSRRWKSVFESYPVFDFDERWFWVPYGKGMHNRIRARELQKKKFMNYVKESLPLRLASVPCVDKFRLYVNNADNEMEGFIRRWVHSVVEKNVKELEVHYVTRDRKFCLPCDLLMSASITSLKTSGCALFGFTATKLSNLRDLSIKDTGVVNDYAFKKLLEGCPLIEDLRLVRCGGLLALSISSLLKLRRVEVHQCTEIDCIDIEAESLETFWYYAGIHQFCKINLKGSRNLKNLTLKDWAMSDTKFQDYITTCPLMEKLVLMRCTNLRRLTILSWKLKSLTLIKCAKLQEANIDAPNLRSFEYSGRRIPFSSMNVFGLCQAKFSFGPSMKTSQYIVDYRKLFGKFDQSKKFKLIIYSKQSMKIYGEPREAHLVPHVFHKLELTESLTSVTKIVENWLRECHGKSLVLVTPDTELTKRIHSLVNGIEDYPSCCRMYSNKCWRHYLADVKTSTSNKTTKTSYVFQWTSRVKE